MSHMILMPRRSGKTHYFSATLLSKPVRVAFAGETIDGREIKEEWLRDIAQTYNPEKYTAEIWPEHWRGLTPGSEFASKGSVVSVFTKEDTVDGEKALALYAVLSPTASLVEMNRKGEKKYASIEVTENFRGSGKAYLTGLAVTDSPASIATEAMKFSATQLHRQITDSIETTIEFTDKDEQQSKSSAFSAAWQVFKNKLSAFSGRSDGQMAEVVQGMTEMLDQFALDQQASEKRYTQLFHQCSELRKEITDLKGKYAQIDLKDANPQVRPPATGGNGFVAVDC